MIVSNMDVNAKVYLVAFTFPGFFRSKEKILNELESKGISFVRKEIITYPGKDYLDYYLQINPDVYMDDSKNNFVLKEIEDLKTELDGLILVFGGVCDKRFFLTGLPTIFVDYNAFPNLQIGFKNAIVNAKKYKTKFITASLSDTDVIDSVSKDRFNDLAEKVELFNVLKKVKNTRILDIQIKGFGTEPHEHWWRLNQEVYLKKLKEYLGIEVVILDYRDLFNEYEKIEEKEAKEIAELWIKESKGMLDGATNEEVMKAAKLYLAADKFIKKFNCNAITMDCISSGWGEKLGGKRRWKVCGSLALTEFQKRMAAVCESDMEALVTAILGNYVTDEQGFMGDFIIDPYNGTVVIAHCQSPVNPHGDDRVPYTIRGEGPRGVKRIVTQVYLPEKGVITGIKINVLERKMAVFTGELVEGGKVYKDFKESSCRTKLVAKTNSRLMYEKFDYETFGNHMVVYYGDFRNKIKDLASLIGFELIELDKQSS